MSTLRSVLIYTIIGFLSLINLSSSQFPFSLNIPTSTQCASLSCNFKWPSLSHYGYVFDISNDGTTIDLNNSLVNFSTISINYVSYNSTDTTCDFSSGFKEKYTYVINIYHRSSSTVSWSQKKTVTNQIDQT